MKRIKKILAAFIMLVTLFTSVSAYELEDGVELNGYKMSAAKAINSAFTWKGITHDKMLFVKAYDSVSTNGYVGFCLDPGKYWHDNPSISLTSKKQLDMEDATSKAIATAVNYFITAYFPGNGKPWDATAVTTQVAFDYAIVQLYVWGCVQDSTWLSKSTDAQAAEIGAALNGAGFGSSSYGYTTKYSAEITKEAKTVIAGIKKHVTVFYADVLTPSGTADEPQSAAFVISKTENVEEQFGKIQVTKKNINGAPVSGVVFDIYRDSACTDLAQTMVTNKDGIAVSEKLVTRDYYVKERIAATGYILDTKVYKVTVVEDQTVRVNGTSGLVNYRYANVSVQKVDTKGNPVSGVKFKLYGWNKNYNDYTTDLGVLTESKDTPGLYVMNDIKETATNFGYGSDVIRSRPLGRMRTNFFKI